MMKHQDIVIEPQDGVEKVINTLNQLARSGEYVFRGYEQQEQIYPGICRKKDGKIKDYRNIEAELLKEFEKYGSNYYKAVSPIDFMSYAQHFGLPTRLIDFTYNPFIALSFAIHNKKYSHTYSDPNDNNYYYVRYAAMKENICVPEIPLTDGIYNNKDSRTNSLAIRSCQCIDSVDDLFGNNRLMRRVDSLIGLTSYEQQTDVARKIENRTILFITPNLSNQRIIMQQGLFMFPYEVDREKHLEIMKNNTSVIRIHKELRADLLKYLDTLGFNPFRLMPDLASICSAIKDRVTDARSDKDSNFKKAGK